MDDYAGICERLDERAEVEVIELNLSCPNVEEAPESSAQIVAGCRSRTSKPLYAKLSPATWDIAESARAVVAAGADGLSLINTIRGMALDPRTLRPKLAPRDGRLLRAGAQAGRARVHLGVCRAVDVPIVGMGGVGSGLDALELIAAGASVVSLGTILFADPAAPARVRRRAARSKPRHAGSPIRSTRGELPMVISKKIPANRRKQFRLTLPAGLLDSSPMVASKIQAQAPARSLDQRMEALKRANDIRVRRAQLKKDLKDGTVQIEGILLDPPEYVSTAKVFDMLMAVPKFGRVKAARLLNQCRISQSKTVGGLSERQRAELVSLFNR